MRSGVLRATRLRVRWSRRAASLLLIGCALLVGLAACARLGLGATAVDGPRLSFQERSHDFGQVSASRPTEYRFAFTNAGNRPLEIGDVQPEPASPGG